jgi:hypothetical protein
LALVLDLSVLDLQCVVEVWRGLCLGLLSGQALLGLFKRSIQGLIELLEFLPKLHVL